MSTRTTIKDAERALRAYCMTAGVPRGHYVTLHDPTAPLELEQDGRTFELRVLHEHDDGRRFCTIPGGWALDGAYGGWEVHVLADYRNADGSPCTGISVPLGHGHVPAREIVTQLEAARYATQLERDRRRVQLEEEEGGR